MEIMKQHRALIIAEGVIFSILGFLAISMPIISTMTVDLFLGCLFIVGGIFKDSSSGAVASSILLSLVYIIFGGYLLAYPYRGAISISFIITCFFIFEGIAKIVFGFQVKPKSQWSWFVISGIISLAMAYIIFAGWPTSAFWVPGLLVGINMIFLGLGMIFFGKNL